MRREQVDRVPCACPLQTGTVALMQACGSSWPEANHASRHMAVLSRAAHDLGRLESVRVPFDVAVDASAFGAPLGNEAMDRQPAVLAPVIRSSAELESLQVPDPTRSGRAPVVLGALERLSKELPQTPIFCGLVMPFNLALQLRGTEASLMDLIVDPALLRGILTKATEWNVAFIGAALEAGADVITMVDSAASGDLISPAQYEEFALPHEKHAVQSIRGLGGMSVLHLCGDIRGHMDGMLTAVPDGISVEQSADLHWAADKMRGKVALMGNVSPTTTCLLYTSPSPRD